MAENRQDQGGLEREWSVIGGVARRLLPQPFWWDLGGLRARLQTIPFFPHRLGVVLRLLECLEGDLPLLHVRRSRAVAQLGFKTVEPLLETSDLHVGLL